MRRHGLTLIELLVVVGILAILAAIGMVNYQHAQIRAKVSRIKSDLRAISTSLESYAADANGFPFDITGKDGKSPGVLNFWYISNSITTPVPYMTSNSFLDPFRQGADNYKPEYHRPRYVNYGLAEFNGAKLTSGLMKPAYEEGETFYGKWRLSFAGPDQKAGPWSPVKTWNNKSGGFFNFPRALVLYDPTNGTNSLGDIARAQAAADPRQAPYQQ